VRFVRIKPFIDQVTQAAVCPSALITEISGAMWAGDGRINVPSKSDGVPEQKVEASTVCAVCFTRTGTERNTSHGNPQEWVGSARGQSAHQVPWQTTG